jgi:hypothetical protein
MTALVLDVGGAFVQRRDEQSAADLAALAGADAYMATGDASKATTEAQLIAAANGYTDGSSGTRVAITIEPGTGSIVSIAISGTHENFFAGVLGQPSWTIAVNASASGVIPDTAANPAPFVFSGDLFGPDGNPQTAYTLAACGATGCAWPEAAKPDSGGSSFAWTDFTGSPAVDAASVNGLIDGSRPLNKTLALGDPVSQRYDGDTSPSFALISTHMTGKVYPVAIVAVGSNRFLGWASFMLTGIKSGSPSQVLGYFLADHQNPRLSASGRCASSCPQYQGSFELSITN